MLCASIVIETGSIRLEHHSDKWHVMTMITVLREMQRWHQILERGPHFVERVSTSMDTKMRPKSSGLSPHAPPCMTKS